MEASSGTDRDRDRVLVFTAAYPPAWRAGGPVRSVHAAILRAADRFNVRVVTSATDLGESRPLVGRVNCWLDRAEGEVAYLHASGPQLILEVMNLFAGLRRWRPQIVQVNSFYNSWYSILPQIYRRLGGWPSAVMLIAVRGEFGEAARALKRRKKNAYLWAYKAFGMDQNVIWQASSENEAVDIRSVFGARARVLVRINDILLAPSVEVPRSASDVESRPLHAVFVSRIVPVKGLDGLLRALALVDRPVDVDVIGPPEDRNYAKQCYDLARLLPRNVTCRFVGALESNSVAGAMESADLLLMPTKGENFGHVIAEALCAATPVMAMDVTPWTAVLSAGGGVLVRDAEPQTWASEINNFAGLGPSERLAAREACRRAFRAWCRTQPRGDIFSDALLLAHATP